MTENVSWLTSCPATDGNFKSRLQSATNDEIAEAVSIMAHREQNGDNSRINAIHKESKRRARNG